MIAAIKNKLAEVEKSHGVRVLYACESGSRAWGFASADSDYDIRFIFVSPRDRYLSVDAPMENIETPLDANLLDVAGWDLRKALKLFSQSNATLLEWLHSPLIYAEAASFAADWRASVPEFLSVKAVAGHYYGLSRKMWAGMNEGGPVTAKKYLYALRAAFCRRFVCDRGTVVPVAFANLADAVCPSHEMREAIHQMIQVKSGGKESDGIGRVPLIDAYLSDQLESWPRESVALPEGRGDMEKLNRLFPGVLD